MAQLSLLINGHTQNESPGITTVNVPDDLAASGDGSTPPRDQDQLRSLIDALSIGVMGKSEFIERTVHQNGSAGKPGSPLAQKENRFRVSFRDDVTLKAGSFTIPCADLSLLPAGSEFLDLTPGTEGGDLAAWLNLYGKSDVGNDITVSSIKFITV